MLIFNNFTDVFRSFRLFQRVHLGISQMCFALEVPMGRVSICFQGAALEAQYPRLRVTTDSGVRYETLSANSSAANVPRHYAPQASPRPSRGSRDTRAAFDWLEWLAAASAAVHRDVKREKCGGGQRHGQPPAPPSAADASFGTSLIGQIAPEETVRCRPKVALGGGAR